MHIWIDVLTPKQVLFLGALTARLEKNGHKVFLTTRRYREVNQLLEMKGYKAKVIGEHGGASVFKKLRASAQRIASLAKQIKRVEPSLAISFSSVEAARVAFGLSIPHYCVSDSPHAVAVSRLSVPLSKRLFTPWIIPKKTWTRYGISSNNITTYRAIDPVVWIKGLRPDKKVLKDLNLDKDKPIVTIRPEETYAAYLLQDGLGQRSITEDVINNLMGVDKDLQIVVVSRYGHEFANKWERFGKSVMVTRNIIDGPSLLAQSSLCIGAGGTMTAEAALLGIPSASVYPGEPTIVEKYLIRLGLVYRSLDPKHLVNTSIKMMSDRKLLKKNRALSRKLLKSMEDPISVIASHVTEYEK
jgi:predicted glycosyltransferase